ncbi:MAG: cellulase (glycosyl hydrolase family 5), partial [Oscillospiraceae bacterium]|nr:cellulase (glycosyl hydrolase family 5) [Oscillospiraceae bacterium]
YDGNYVSDELLKKLGNEDSYLDFYSPHYYFWMTQNWGDPFAGSPEDYKLDGTKPVVIGETPADTSEGGVTLKDEYSAAYDNGWNGVMAWTSNGVDGCGGLDDIRPAAEYIAEEKLAAG